MSAFLVKMRREEEKEKRRYNLMWTRYVTCRQTTLKHWVLLLPVQILTMISATELLHVSRVFLLTALKMPQEFLVNEPLHYEEVAKVCSRLKRGISRVLIDYEHVLFACPPFWKVCFRSSS